MQKNLVKPIKFSDKYLKAIWLTNAENYYIENRTIVVNLGQEKAYLAVSPEKYLLPRTSTILKEVSLKSGDSFVNYCQRKLCQIQLFLWLFRNSRGKHDYCLICLNLGSK